MRILVVPAIIALLIEPAYSQRRPALGTGSSAQDDINDRRIERERKELEQQHKATLDRMPDQKKKNTDPWQNVRGNDPGKKKSD